MAGVFPYVIGELEGVTFDSGTTWNTNVGSYDPDASRGSMEQVSTGFMRRDLNGTNKEVWMHGYVNQPINSQADGDFMTMFDGSFNEVCLVDGNNGNLFFEYYNGSGMTVVDTGLLLSTGVLQTFDMHAFIDDSAGIFEIYVDGVLIHATSPADTDHGRDVEIVEYQSINSGGNCHWSECIVNDTTTLGRRLLTLGIDDDGTDVDWGGDFTDIDEVGTVDDLDFITSTANNDVSTFTFPATDSAFANFDVEALVVCSTGASDGAGNPDNIRHYIDSNGTSDTGNDFAGLTGAFSPGHQTPFALDPDTASEWTISGIDAVEIGVESQS